MNMRINSDPVRFAPQLSQTERQPRSSLKLAPHRLNSSVPTPSKETTSTSVAATTTPSSETAQTPTLAPHTPNPSPPAAQLSKLEKEAEGALGSLNRLKPPKKKLELKQIKAGIDYARNTTKAIGNATTFLSSVPVAVILTPITAPLGAIGQGIEWLRRKKDKTKQEDHITKTLVAEYNKALPGSVESLSSEDIKKAKENFNHELNHLYGELNEDLKEYRALRKLSGDTKPLPNETNDNKKIQEINEKKTALENKWKSKGIVPETLVKLAIKGGDLAEGDKSEVAQQHIQHLANQTWEALFQGAMSKANLEILAAQGHVNQAALLTTLASAQALVTVPLAIAIIAGATSAQPLAPVNIAFLALSLGVASAGLYYLHRTRPNAFRQAVSTPKRIYFQTRQTLASMSTAISRASTKKKAIEARYKQIALLKMNHQSTVKIDSESGRAKINDYKRKFETRGADKEIDWNAKANQLDQRLSQLEEGINHWKGKVKEIKQDMVKAKFADNVRAQYKMNPMKDNIKGFADIVLELSAISYERETKIAFDTYLEKMGITMQTVKGPKKELMELGRKAEVTNQDIVDLVHITAKLGQPIPLSVRNFMKHEMKMKEEDIPKTYDQNTLDKFANLHDPFAIKNTAENLLKVDPNLSNPSTVAMLRLLKIKPEKISSNLFSRQEELEVAMKNFFGMSHDDFVRFVKVIEEEQKRAEAAEQKKADSSSTS